MDLELVREALGLGGEKGLVEGRRGVGVEVVQHEDNALGVGVADVDQVLDDVGEVDPGAAGGR
jgi:DNA-binding FadR family transcriptional regulator